MASVPDAMALHAVPLESADGLAVLASECSLPQPVLDHLKTKGFVSVALIGFALSEANEAHEFIDSLQFDEAKIEMAKFSPARSALLRLMSRCSQCVQLSGNQGKALPPAPPVEAAIKTKLTSQEFAQLKDAFQKSYPGELLCDQTTPSLPFLSLVKEMHDSKTYRWIPWKSRISEAVQASFNESRPPRNDQQLLRSIMKSESDDWSDLPSNHIPTSGPVEAHLVKYQLILAIALAMVEAAHLLTVKRFNHKFQQFALMNPRDQAFRAPSMQEVLDADKHVWDAIFAIRSENDWNLEDSINELTFCRQEIQGCLQPRLKAPHQVHKPPKRAGHEVSEHDRTPKRAKPGGAQNPKQGDQFASHWFRKHNGTGICIRFNTASCKSADKCRYLHICPVPDAQGKICGAKHSAKQHRAAPH